MVGLRIELENPSRSYFPGQVVEGRVVIQNAREDKVKGITISLEGTGQVHWREKETYKEYSFPCCSQQRRRIVTNAATESYVLLERSLVGEGRHLTTIPEMTRFYPFRFTLPKNLPSTFTSKIGEVVYLLKAEVMRSSSLLNFSEKARLPFTMNALVDLNLENLTGMRQQCEMKIGHLSAILRITRSGFVPGEEIDFKVLIFNWSRRKITLTKLSLQQIAKFDAQGHSKILKSIVAEIRGPSVEVGESEIWESYLSIPSMPPTKLGGICRIIDVSYWLQLEMRIFEWLDPLVGMLPVIIGTIPLRDTFGDLVRTISTNSVSSCSSTIGNSYGRPPHGITGAPSATPIANSPFLLSPSSLTSAFPSPPAYSEAVSSSPLLFSDYLDLPPPSYLEAVGAEGFT